MGIIQRKKAILLNEPHLVSTSGKLVTFNTDMVAPLEITGIGNITIVGKNMYNVSSYPLTAYRMIDSSNGNSRNGSSYPYSSMPYMPCSMMAGKTITLNKRPAPNEYNVGFAFFAQQVQTSYISGWASDGTSGTPWTIVVPANANYMRFSVPLNETDIQIEIGDESTAFEAYSEETKTAGTARVSRKGINNIYSSSGNVTVKYWTH